MAGDVISLIYHICLIGDDLFPLQLHQLLKKINFNYRFLKDTMYSDAKEGRVCPVCHEVFSTWNFMRHKSIQSSDLFLGSSCKKVINLKEENYIKEYKESNGY